jgi:hypothetical protein
MPKNVRPAGSYWHLKVLTLKVNDPVSVCQFEILSQWFMSVEKKALEGGDNDQM